MARNRERHYQTCKKQDWKCWLCGLPMIKDERRKPSDLASTVEHLSPKGSRDYHKNVVATHHYCNNHRHHNLFCKLSWRTEIQKRIDNNGLWATRVHRNR